MGRQLWTYPGIKLTMLLQMTIALLQGITIIMFAKGLAEAISALFAAPAEADIRSAATLAVCAFLTRHFLSAISSKLAYRYAYLTGSSLRRQMLEKLFKLGPRHTGREGTGSLVTTVLEGTLQFRTYLELLVPRMAAVSFIPLLILGYTAYLDRWSSVILVLTMPILIIFLILLGLAARKQMDRQWASYRILSNHYIDALHGLETLRYLGLSHSHARTIERVSDSYRSSTMKTLRVAFLSTFALDFFTMLSVASVAVSLGIRLVNGQLSLLPALTILILAPEYFLPIRMVGADYHATLKGKEAGEAMLRVLHQPDPTHQDLEQKVPPKQNLATAGSSAGGLPDTLEIAGLTVQLEGDTPPLLTEVSFRTAASSSWIGVIGPSGSGKSTLLEALAGFLSPAAGHLTYRGEVIDWTSSCWREQAVYLPQQPYIFSATLMDNIRFYKPEAPEDQVLEALAQAGLSELIQALPKGLQEPIGSGGRMLSGGQEQRVALARAFLSGRPIVLLDEPTAHLDIETELELKETMGQLFQNRLVILATHRLHWLEQLDQVLLLDNGRLAAAGTPREVIQSNRTYFQHLFYNQPKERLTI